MNVAADPVDSGIVTDSLVEWVDHDDFIPDMSSIIANPVGVQNTKFLQLPSNAFLGTTLEVTGRLLLLHTMMPWLSIDNALEAHLLAATTLDAHTVDHDALLSLVTQLPGLVWPCWARRTNDSRKLAKLPSAYTTDESHHIRLLLAPQLLKILVGTHGSKGCKPFPLGFLS